jgi:hypothetical protein
MAASEPAPNIHNWSEEEGRSRYDARRGRRLAAAADWLDLKRRGCRTFPRRILRGVVRERRGR